MDRESDQCVACVVMIPGSGDAEDRQRSELRISSKLYTIPIATIITIITSMIITIYYYYYSCY